MRIPLLIITLGMLVGCGSSPTSTPAPRPSAEAPPAPADENLQNEASDVLAHKEPGAIKCPRRAKLVKGKCVMQVEETE